MPEIPGIDDQLDVGIRGGNALEDRHRAVRGVVVDEQVIVPVAPELGHLIPDAVIHFLHVGFLVETGSEDANAFHWVAGAGFSASMK